MRATCSNEKRTDTATKHANPSMLGITLMACAMLSIPLVDGLAKYLSTAYSPLFLAWTRMDILCR